MNYRRLLRTLQTIGGYWLVIIGGFSIGASSYWSYSEVFRYTDGYVFVAFLTGMVGISIGVTLIRVGSELIKRGRR